MAVEFDPYHCPVGVANEKSIEHVGEKLDMAIARLEEKMDDMKSDLASHMNEGFANVNDKLDKVEGRLNNLESNLDSRIEKKVKQFHGDIVQKIVGWVVCGLGAAVVVSVVTKYVLQMLKL